MTEQETNSTRSNTQLGQNLINGIFGIDFALAIIVYFISGMSWQAAIAFWAISKVMTLVIFLGLIPIVGPVIYYFLAKKFIKYVISISPLTWNWVVGLEFYFGLAVTIVLTCISLFVLVGAFSK